MVQRLIRRREKGGGGRTKRERRQRSDPWGVWDMKHMGGNNLSKTKRASAQEDWAWTKTIARIEELGRSRNKLLTKSTVDTVVAIAVGIMTVTERLFPPGTVPSVRENSNKDLRVPDAESLLVFLKQARKVYREAHCHTSQRGRRTEEIDAFMTLLKLSSESGGMPTQGEMVRALMGINLSQNTAYKYAKLYRLSLRWSRDQTQFTDAERQWFAKNKGINSWKRLYCMRLYLHHKRLLEETGGSELF